MNTPTHDDFRKVGMTGDAANYPRSSIQIEMMAAFLNVTPEQMPDTYRYFANEHMRDAWVRVEEVVRKSCQEAA